MTLSFRSRLRSVARLRSGRGSLATEGAISALYGLGVGFLVGVGQVIDVKRIERIGIGERFPAWRYLEDGRVISGGVDGRVVLWDHEMGTWKLLHRHTEEVTICRGERQHRW